MRYGLVVCLCSINCVLGADQAAGQWEPKMAAARDQLSHAAYGEAVETLRQALAVAETFGPRDARRWVTRDTLASTDEALSRLDEAESQYRTALDEIQTANGKDNGDYAVVEAHLASVLGLRGRLHQAEVLVRDALARQARFFSADSGRLAGARNFLAEILVGQHRYLEAEDQLNLALPVFERQPSQAMTAVVFNNFAIIRHYQRHDAEARQMLERSIEILRRDLAPNHPLLGRACHNLASMDFITGRREEAGPLYRRALDCLQHLGPSHPVYLAVLADYALFLRRTGHKAEARSVEARVKSALAKSPSIPARGMSVDVSSLRPN
ncbi:MAG: tetratricopeptide repeat protein [Bryobacteraceae bacterium]